MNLRQWLAHFQDNPATARNIAYWHVQDSRPAVFEPFPEWLDDRIACALKKRQIWQLYSHQRQAVDLARDGRHVTVVTPTASGKTLCYNLPVLNRIVEDPSARAIYLFPTKALSADQVSELYELIQAAEVDVKTYTYDGDTPPAARKAVRQAGHIVVTNPDMLHSGILPHHTKWVKLFENLKYVVIDEVHSYRGVFGSHLANVIRRLRRLCAFYGSNPQFICCSATIANPRELAEHITGVPMALVNQNGAPQGEKHFIFYNPPVVNEQLGIRASSLQESKKIATDLVINGIPTIVFSRARVTMEVLVSALKTAVKDVLGDSGLVRGYRGGYLPSERRAIEKGLREGSVRAVVSTNALELGIDIGSLDACVLNGYPGTIASTWQQAGRAGRRQGESLTILVASSSPLDQYIVNHPDFFFGRSPERALINPDNLYILLNHLKCAAYELPFEEGERFGGVESTGEMLEYLCEERILQMAGGRYYWMAEEFPQAGINLRSASDQNFVIVDISVPSQHRVLGEMDRFTVPMLLHQYAIYLHEGRQYQVEQLDFDNKKAYVRAVDVDYYTDANLTVSVKVLDDFDQRSMGEMERHRGEVLVSSIVTLFKKMKLDTQENLGWGPVTLPELEMHTTACWWILPEALEALYGREEVQTAMVGLAHLLRGIAPAYLMCAPGDIHVSYHTRDSFTKMPTLFLNDGVPGGLGLSDRVYEMDFELFRRALEAVQSCPCENGCPACIGAAAEGAKATLISILERLNGGTA